MSNPVPEGWSIESLDGKVEIISGFPFKSALFCDNPERMGVIRIRDLVRQNLETFYDGDFDQLYVVTKGDILIGMDGDFNIVKWKSKSALLNQRICKVTASENKGFDTDFLFHSLVEDLDQIHASTGATTVKHLSVKDIRGIEKAYPPLPEQQKIAAILSTVDNVIEKTRAQIDKLKDLKTGMMQELLTKGIGHTEFKDSPVGRIPVGWDVVRLDYVTRVIDSLHQTPRFSEVGLPMIRVSDIKPGKVSIEKALKVDEAVFAQFIKNHKPTTGDLLMSRVGSYGVCCYVDSDIDICLGQNTVVIVPQKVESRFLYYSIYSRSLQDQIEFEVAGSGYKSLSLASIRALSVPFPPIAEQKKITGVLRSIDDQIDAIVQKLGAYTSAKKALMQDLLTGKVRVKVDNNLEDRMAV